MNKIYFCIKNVYFSCHFHLKRRGYILKNNLRVLMAEKHLNITELSEKTGISRNTIANIFHERTTRIDLKTISTLCNFFRCTPNDLILIYMEEFQQLEEVASI